MVNLSTHDTCPLCGNKNCEMVRMIINGGIPKMICRPCYEVMRREKAKREKAAAESCARQSAGLPPAAPEKT